MLFDWWKTKTPKYCSLSVIFFTQFNTTNFVKLVNSLLNHRFGKNGEKKTQFSSIDFGFWLSFSWNGIFPAFGKPHTKWRQYFHGFHKEKQFYKIKVSHFWLWRGSSQQNQDNNQQNLFINRSRIKSHLK